MRILLVEDDESIAAFVEQGLTESGFAVDVVDNGPGTRLDSCPLRASTRRPGFTGWPGAVPTRQASTGRAAQRWARWCSR